MFCHHRRRPPVFYHKPIVIQSSTWLALILGFLWTVLAVWVCGLLDITGWLQFVAVLLGDLLIVGVLL